VQQWAELTSEIMNVNSFEQTSLFYSASYFNLGGLELCFGGNKATKATRDDGNVAKLQLAF